jgi:hypothetical protein
MDYPFSNWTAFYAAMSESLQSEFYAEKYPNYANAIAELGSDVDYNIVKGFLEKGLDAQEGLDGLINTVIDGSRYAKESCTSIHKMVLLLMEHNALPDIDKLFRLRYEPVWSNFEDEVQFSVSRGILLKAIDQKIPIDLSSINSMYWEDIEHESIDYHTAVKMSIKYEKEQC